jgi:hypothetical protein
MGGLRSVTRLLWLVGSTAVVLGAPLHSTPYSFAVFEVPHVA